jgi:uncharacterized membrane protein YbhN (UPF0104 family)
MKLRRLDWLLVAIAVLAVVVGPLNGPICDPASTPPGITDLPGSFSRCEFRFPVEIILGAAIAVLALVIVAVRGRVHRVDLYQTVMKLRRLDWFLLAVAVIALLAGFLLNGPICYPVIGPVGYAPPAGQCAGLRFPIETAAGVEVAAVALLIVVVRVRRRESV